jgi:hypothetical protein
MALVAGVPDPLFHLPDEALEQVFTDSPSTFCLLPAPLPNILFVACTIAICRGVWNLAGSDSTHRNRIPRLALGAACT